MKIRLLALLMFILMLLSSCAPDIEQVDNDTQIYATFYPIYALSNMAIGNTPGIDLKCLIQPQDDCMRLYELSDWDVSILGYNADTVIIGGNGLENFESSLYSFEANGPAVISASYALPLYEYSDKTDGNTGHLTGKNPHIYMSVAGAMEMVKTINSSLKELYPESSSYLDDALSTSLERLDALNNYISNIRSKCEGNSVILMNEALIYTALDFGLNVAYEYDRESGTTLYGANLEEAVDNFKQTGSTAILIEKQAPAELTKALAAEGFDVIAIDIMSSYKADNSTDYISIQYDNADAISEVFK